MPAVIVVADEISYAEMRKNQISKNTNLLLQTLAGNDLGRQNDERLDYGSP